MAEFRIIVTIDPSGARRGGRQVESQLNRMNRAAQRTRRLLAGAFAFAGLGLGIGQLTDLADTFTQLTNQVQVAVGDLGDVGGTLDDLFEIANRTRTPIEGITQLFQRASIAANELGASNDELLTFVEAVGSGLAVQGGSAAAASGALLQLAQALGAGVVRAEEFNSILEGAFPIALAAAQGLDEAGGSVARLRQLIVEGQVSSDEFFRAILSQSDQLKDTLGGTVVTLSQSFTVLRNTLIQSLGEIDRQAGVTQGLATQIVALSQFILDDLTPNLLNLTRALQGTLEPQDRLTRSVERFAIAILTATGFLQVFGRSLVDTVSVAGRVFANRLAGIGAAISVGLEDGAEAGLNVLREANVDARTDVTTTFRKLNEDLRLIATDTIDQITQVVNSAARVVVNAREDLLPSGVEGAAVTPPTPIDTGLQDVIDDQQKFLDGLDETRRALQLSVDAGLEYGDALEIVQIQALAAEGGIDDFTEQAIRLTGEVRRLSEEADRLADIQADAARVFEDTRTETELFEIELERLRELYDANAISAQTFARAVAAGIEDITANLAQENEALQTFLNRARENAQDTLSGFLADPLAEGLDQLPFQFAQVLQRLAAELLASEIFRLLGNLGQGQGGFLGLVGGFFGGTLPAFQSGGAFTVGGSGGPDSQLVAFRATPRERVTIQTPQQQMAAAQPAVVVSPAQVTNVIVEDPSMVPGSINAGQADDAIVNVIQRRAATIKSFLVGR